jgi:hypothetical protein
LEKNESLYLLAFCRGCIAFCCGCIGVSSRPYRYFGVISFHHIKTVKNGNGRLKNLFVAAFFSVTDLDLKPCTQDLVKFDETRLRAKILDLDYVLLFLVSCSKNHKKRVNLDNDLTCNSFWFFLIYSFTI